ncbi:PREDICTED: L-type lectin-domain [Prunus dulcis]|uniref:PREDICTED: L-type lectin-domain n=1 Tax=Prunus dulcis TaxID=3755 RepID=A0A5E4FDZ2_PRUDU|nr:probable L-type lectin-domain containing receptor kinase S.5 [Prunus dulcis]VVA23828.1 PREDICTED: L-type lectin-domain [Prunus dulcis]
MFLLLVLSTLLFNSQASVNDQTQTTFNFPTFSPQSCSNGSLICMGSVTASNGHLSLTPEPEQGNSSSSSSSPLYKVGRVLYRYPVRAWPAFISTTFTVRISAFPNSTGSGDGMAFVFAQDSGPSPPDSYGSFLGLLNRSTEGRAVKQLGIELDTFMNQEFDPDGNHIAIDATSIMNPVVAKSLNSTGIELKSGRDIKFRIDYDGWNQILQISVGYSENPTISFLNYSIDMSQMVPSSVYVGFTASTGTLPESHQVLDWVFTSVQLPGIPPSKPGSDKKVHHWNTKSIWVIDLPIFLGMAILIACTYPLILRVLRRNQCIGNQDEDDIESQSRTAANAPEMFTYKQLSVATQNFCKENLLGSGGFGIVYKGIISSDPPKTIAVKKISATSKQGEREYLAEICTIGRLRHKNIVQLQGWCHENEHRFLVYDYMPNGSLDRYIGKPYLDWRTRYKILTGLASALLYLHEECGNPVVHRDIKPDNVMLDSDFNAHLGDFGLARLMFKDASVTIPMAGTPAYLAPEFLGFSGKATQESDVYSFGMVVLEVVCGRRSKGFMDDYSLVEHVWNSYTKNAMLDCVDQMLDGKFEEEQVRRTLIVGLACLHTYCMLRPKMRKVVQILLNPNEPLMELPDTRARPSAVYLSVSSSAPTTEFGSTSSSYIAS